MALSTLKLRKPTGLIITQQGTIERHKVTQESSLVWGENKATVTRPCWLTPSFFRTWKKGKYILLPSAALQAIALPGETSMKTSEAMIRTVYKESFQLKTSRANKATRTEGSQIFMTMAVLLCVALVAVMSAMSIPQAIGEWTNETIQQTAGTANRTTGN